MKPTLLTDAGWPRPIISCLPIPWVSPPHNLAEMNRARGEACASGAICQVCGLGFQDDEDAYALVREPRRPKNMRKVTVRAMDNGILHLRCLLVSLKHCPKLKALRAEKMLQVVRTKGNSATVRCERKKGGKAYAEIAGKDCKFVRIGTLVKG